jgi:DNA-binding transcriptional regulator YhcF (GntR family)
MRLWLNRTGEVSLREQLITQVQLAILCRELLPGQRLPSIRELARRYGIHSNTVSGAYGELEAEGWLELRRGSGVYVRNTLPAGPTSPEYAADRLIGELLAKARKLDLPPALVRTRLRRWLRLEPPSRWLLIDSDPEPRSILLAEMQQALKLPVAAASLEDCAIPALLRGSILAVRPSKAPAIRAALPPDVDLHILEIRPVTAALLQYLPHAPGALIGVASRWTEFLRIARTMLTAAGVAPESLLVCDANLPNWKRGLKNTTAVVCDATLESQLPKGPYPIPFRLLDQVSLDHLHQMESNLTAADSTQSAM